MPRDLPRPSSTPPRLPQLGFWPATASRPPAQAISIMVRRSSARTRPLRATPTGSRCAPLPQVPAAAGQRRARPHWVDDLPALPDAAELTAASAPLNVLAHLPRPLPAGAWSALNPTLACAARRQAVPEEDGEQWTSARTRRGSERGSGRRISTRHGPSGLRSPLRARGRPELDQLPALRRGRRPSGRHSGAG